jgi:hypothetical protein
VKYRSTLEGARTRARAGLERAGYTLTDEQERTMVFARQLGRSALRLNIRFTPSEEGMLRRWETELGVSDGPELTDEIAVPLQQEIHGILEPLGPTTLPYIRD